MKKEEIKNKKTTSKTTRTRTKKEKVYVSLNTDYALGKNPILVRLELIKNFPKKLNLELKSVYYLVLIKSYIYDTLHTNNIDVETVFISEWQYQALADLVLYCDDTVSLYEFFDTLTYFFHKNKNKGK